MPPSTTRVGLQPQTLRTLVTNFPLRRLAHNSLLSVRVRVTLRLTVSQSVCLGVEPRLGLMTRYLFFIQSYSPVHMGRPL
jgi:hypothetical protein